MGYNFDELYDIYQAQYVKSLKQTGGSFAESMQSKTEFKVNFIDVKNQIKLSKGHRLSGTQISQQLARNDVYEYSQKQAKAVKEFLREERGAGAKLPSVADIRAGNVPQSFWDNIREMYKKQKAAGKSTKEAKKYISTHVFGS